MRPSATYLVFDLARKCFHFAYSVLFGRLNARPQLGFAVQQLRLSTRFYGVLTAKFRSNYNLRDPRRLPFHGRFPRNQVRFTGIALESF
jgi:hypothetical protein